MSRSVFERKMTFRVSPQHHSAFLKLMKKEFHTLESKNINYNIITDKTALTPKMCFSGICLVGVDDIKTELKEILSQIRT